MFWYLFSQTASEFRQLHPHEIIFYIFELGYKILFFLFRKAVKCCWNLIYQIDINFFHQLLSIFCKISSNYFLVYSISRPEDIATSSNTLILTFSCCLLMPSSDAIFCILIGPSAGQAVPAAVRLWCFQAVRVYMDRLPFCLKAEAETVWDGWYHFLPVVFLFRP